MEATLHQQQQETKQMVQVSLEWRKELLVEKFHVKSLWRLRVPRFRCIGGFWWCHLWWSRHHYYFIGTWNCNGINPRLSQLGSFDAMEKNILTLQSAKKKGDYRSTVLSIAPWLFTVVASNTDHHIIDKAILANEKELDVCINQIPFLFLPFLFGFCLTKFSKSPSLASESKARKVLQKC